MYKQQSSIENVVCLTHC